MKQVTFYLLQNNKIINKLNTYEALACDIASKYWRSGKRSLIICNNEKQAYKLDEGLWKYKPYTFIPHNLLGKGPKKGAPIEISWSNKISNNPYDVLIVLKLHFINYFSNFNKIIDFVPYEDILIKLARDRYIAYRNIGFHLVTKIPKYY
ncbi:DNA polymerase III subunit chi [Serratia symbiotica]|nr:DNA polymerase III subunit chi [Serratia symbiotica]